MRINTLGYLLKQGFQNIWRNKMFSLASIATMSACIFLFGVFFAIVTNFEYIVKSAEEGVGVTVFFEDDTSEERIKEIGEEIEARDEVIMINFISAEEAWDSFKDQYFRENSDLAEGFADDNPLVYSANYEVYVEDIDTQNELVKFIEGIEGVQKVNRSEIAANTLSAFNRLIGYISIAIIAILLSVSIFLISNTVTIGISVRSEEIGIMKLVGATDFFVRSPFIIEGIIIGLLGAALPMILLYVMYNRVVTFILDKFNLLIGIIQFLPVETVFATLVPVAVALGIGIGFVGSMFTVRKHLKV